MAGVVIHEFVADNANGLADEDGDRSDWLELKNTDAAPIDITGWYLTDDALNPTKWQLPATVLNPGEYLTIFASDKDRAVAGQELHTNFKLAKEGEYLGLVMADGTTVAHEYAPFPEQFEDVSYGIGASAASTVNVDLIADMAPAKVISLSSQDTVAYHNWYEIVYDDAAWHSKVTGIGFDRGDNQLDPYVGDGSGTAGTGVGQELTTTQMPSTRNTAYIRIPFTVTDKDQLASLDLNMRFDDGFIAFLNGREVKRENVDTASKPAWNLNARANRPDVPDVITPVSYDLTPYLETVVNGTNMLAILGSNHSSQNTDFLIDPTLVAERGTGTVADTYMVAPTPGDDNGLGTSGFVGDTQFSVDRGFFNAPFQAAIATDTPGATIRYTLDGSAPSETNGTLYAGPITIGTTTTLRAIAYMAGFTSSNVGTVTYVFLDDVIVQDGSSLPAFTGWSHFDDQTGLPEADWAMAPDIVGTYSSTIIDDMKSVPTVSVVMDWEDLFGDGTQHGIYTERTTWKDKSDERYSSVEFFTADGSEQFHADAAIEIQGHSSTDRWKADKLSFEIKFKFPYGDTELNQAIFNDPVVDQTATSEFDALILDAAHNYTWIHQNTAQNSTAIYLHDQVVSDLQNLAGGAAPHGRYVNLYLNGLYWGLYNLHEKPIDSFGAEYFGGDKDEYDVVKHSPDTATHYQWVDGGLLAASNYGTLLDEVRDDVSQLAQYQEVEALLNIDDFVTYMIVNFYGANHDWGHNNWYASHHRLGGQWHFHSWDSEHAFRSPPSAGQDSLLYDYVANEDLVDGPIEIHQRLMASPEYKATFNDQVERLLRNGGLLTPLAANDVYQARVDEIDRAIVGESARWGDNRAATSYDRDDWLANLDNVLWDGMAGDASFFEGRTGVTLTGIANRGWLVSLAAPVFNNYGGEVPPGFDVTITKPVGSPGAAEIYYTTDGSDPRLVGGAENPSAAHSTGPVSIDIDTAKQVKARIKNGTEWSPIIQATFTLPDVFPVRITELHYHPDNYPGVTDPEDLEFIELLNTGGQTVSLEGVQITQFTTPPFAFGRGIDLAAGERIVVARNPTVFQSVYGTGINVLPTGYSTANLSNGGERIALLGPFGETLQDFIYDDIAPWPTSPDGGGPSLEIIDPLGDATNAANWRASAMVGGSPGTDGELEPIPGDYDGNRTVEQADYNVWRSMFGQLVDPGAGADGNGDGTIDAADYLVWRKNLGMSDAAGSASFVSATSVDQTDGAVAIATSQTFEEPLVGVPPSDVALGSEQELPLPSDLASVATPLREIAAKTSSFNNASLSTEPVDAAIALWTPPTTKRRIEDVAGWVEDYEPDADKFAAIWSDGGWFVDHFDVRSALSPLGVRR